jgi:hypothetical protein
MLDEFHDSCINDDRLEGAFRSTTYLGYKTVDVRSQYIHALRTSDPDKACYWCVELVCSGKFTDIFDCLITVFSKNIHHGNPKMVFLLRQMYQLFSQIAAAKKVEHEKYSLLELRNHTDVRSLFTDLSYMIATEGKHPSVEEISGWQRTEDCFSATFVMERARADHDQYSRFIFCIRDPVEFAIPKNEFVFHLTCGQTFDALFWMEWMFAYEQLHHDRLEFRTRRFRENDEMVADGKWNRELCWLVWEAVLVVAGVCDPVKEKMSGTPMDLIHDKEDSFSHFAREVVKESLQLFLLEFKRNVIKKRKGLLYFVISWVCDWKKKKLPTTMNYPSLGRDQVIRAQVLDRVSLYFKERKGKETMDPSQWISKTKRKEWHQYVNQEMGNMV